MSRYEQLIGLVRERQPGTILEIGTWNGRRALEMLQACPSARYIGFDLFEAADEVTDREEFNVKSHYSAAAVRERLRGHDVLLVEGNTRDTLPAFSASHPGQVELAFIDGGHSVETIRGDWEGVRAMMKPRGVVIFDDYYTGLHPERIAQVGCNRIVEGLENAEILPAKDNLEGGGFVQMVKVEV